MDKKQSKKLNIPNELIDNMLIGVHSQEDLWGKNGIMTQLSKAILERMLNAEMDFHLNDTENGRANGNSRNGHGKKNVRSTWGEFELITPRDRQSLRYYLNVLQGWTALMMLSFLSMPEE